MRVCAHICAAAGVLGVCARVCNVCTCMWWVLVCEEAELWEGYRTQGEALGCRGGRTGGS